MSLTTAHVGQIMRQNSKVLHLIEVCFGGCHGKSWSDQIRWDKGLFVFVLLCVCCLACLRGVYIAAFQVTRRPVCNNWCFPNPPPLFRPPLTAANLFYRVTRFSPSLPEALRTSYQSHSVPHSPAQACTPPDSYLLLSFPLCQSSELTLVSGLIGDPQRTDARAIIHSKL